MRWLFGGDTGASFHQTHQSSRSCSNVVPSAGWRRKDLPWLYGGPTKAKRPSVIFTHIVSLPSSAFPKVSTPTVPPWAPTPHQVPCATAESFSNTLWGVYCRICHVTLESHLCIWKCIGSRCFCMSYFPYGVFALQLST